MLFSWLLTFNINNIGYQLEITTGRVQVWFYICGAGAGICMIKLRDLCGFHVYICRYAYILHTHIGEHTLMAPVWRIFYSWTVLYDKHTVYFNILISFINVYARNLYNICDVWQCVSFWLTYEIYHLFECGYDVGIHIKLRAW
jgi:hypothetical protein